MVSIIMHELIKIEESEIYDRMEQNNVRRVRKDGKKTSSE